MPRWGVVAAIASLIVAAAPIHEAAWATGDVAASSTRPVQPSGTRPPIRDPHEQSVTLSSTLGEVVLSLDPRQRFIEPKCLFIPLTVSWRLRPGTTVVGLLAVTKPGSAVNNQDSFVLGEDEPSSGSYLDYVYACPADGTGQFALAGTVTFLGPGASELRTMPTIGFQVAAALTTIAGLSATRRASATLVHGRARVGASRAAGGVVVVSVREPGGSSWMNLAVPDVGPTGEFSARIAVPLATGTRVLAEVISCTWCTGARAIVTVR